MSKEESKEEYKDEPENESKEELEEGIHKDPKEIFRIRSLKHYAVASILYIRSDQWFDFAIEQDECVHIGSNILRLNFDMISSRSPRDRLNRRTLNSMHKRLQNDSIAMTRYANYLVHRDLVPKRPVYINTSKPEIKIIRIMEDTFRTTIMNNVDLGDQLASSTEERVFHASKNPRFLDFINSPGEYTYYEWTYTNDNLEDAKSKLKDLLEDHYTSDKLIFRYIFTPLILRNTYKMYENFYGEKIHEHDPSRFNDCLKYMAFAAHNTDNKSSIFNGIYISLQVINNKIYILITNRERLIYTTVKGIFYSKFSRTYGSSKMETHTNGNCLAEMFKYETLEEIMKNYYESLIRNNQLMLFYDKPNSDINTISSCSVKYVDTYLSIFSEQYKQ